MELLQTFESTDTVIAPLSRVRIRDSYCCCCRCCCCCCDRPPAAIGSTRRLESGLRAGRLRIQAQRATSDRRCRYRGHELVAAVPAQLHLREVSIPRRQDLVFLEPYHTLSRRLADFRKSAPQSLVINSVRKRTREERESYQHTGKEESRGNWESATHTRPVRNHKNRTIGSQSILGKEGFWDKVHLNYAGGHPVAPDV